MKKEILILWLIVFSFIYCADVKHRDRPARGEWNFQLEKIWEIESAGEEVFGQPFSMNVSDEGWLYVFDPKNNTNYIFDSDGEFIKSFARGGQGPGEIIRQELIHIVGEFLIIPGMNGIHYFTKNGDYVKTVRPERVQGDPRVFIDEKSFISAPLTAVNLPEGVAHIVKINMETEKEMLIADYALTQAGVAASDRQIVDMIVIGLSPVMTLCLHDGILYWGLSDSYVINMSGLNGENLGSVSLNRKRRQISDSKKVEFFASFNLPQDILPQMVRSFPNALTHFHRLEVHNDLLYVHVPDLDVELGRTKIKQIDIFSPEGKYLYRAKVDFGEGLKHLFSPLGNLVIKDGHMYAACEKENDTVVISKFSVTLPEKE